MQLVDKRVVAIDEILRYGGIYGAVHILRNTNRGPERDPPPPPAYVILQ